MAVVEKVVEGIVITSLTEFYNWSKIILQYSKRIDGQKTKYQKLKKDINKVLDEKTAGKFNKVIDNQIRNLENASSYICDTLQNIDKAREGFAKEQQEFSDTKLEKLAAETNDNFNV